MDPSTLETLIILYMNKDLLNERDLQLILDHNKDFEELAAPIPGNRRRHESDSEDDDDSDEENKIATAYSPIAIFSRIE